MMKGLPQSLRWAICFTLALGLHGAAAAALLARWTDHADMVANAPVIMIDLAPVAVAPTIIPNEMPPDIVESKLAEPTPEPEPEKPIEKIEMPPDPAPQPELTAVPPPPKPVEKKVEKKKPKQRERTMARAASSADNLAERSAAPMPGAVARDSNAIPNWTSQLVSRLERYKRYPSDAQSRGDTGVVRLAFSVDRSGGVHSVRIVGSSGSSVLDRETLSLVERASPLPAPPSEMSGSQIAVVVPIRYNMR
jgi:protein TonB